LINRGEDNEYFFIPLFSKTNLSNEMKPVVLVMGLFICSYSLLAQNQSNEQNIQPDHKIVVNELFLSINHTWRGNRGSPDQLVGELGGGIGIDHSFHLGNVVEYLLGAEYNHTRQFQECSTYRPGSIFDKNYNVDITRNISCLSVPTGFRYSVGRGFKVFFEHGILYDITILSKEKGTKVNSSTGERSRYNRDCQIPNAPGLFAGFGVRIPGTNIEYLIKTDLKLRFVGSSEYQPIYFKVDFGFKWR
jgi:hypothetical protein